MKILQIFNRYAYIGGEEIVVEQISHELAANHDFRCITFDSNEWAAEAGVFNRVRQFLAMAWNPKSIEVVRRELAEFQPDVVLLHNIMPIGSAGLFVFLMDCGIPVVQYIHNFRPFSVNGYCWGNGKLLPQGLHQNFFPEIFAGAWQNSRIKTAWYALLIWSLHRFGVYRRIDGWIAISNYMKKAFVEGGIDEDRIAVISHSWQPQCAANDLPEAADHDDEPVFLFLGRLTEEKGLHVLLDAWADFERSSEIGHLMIAGDGPLAEEVKMRCSRMRRASYLGFKSGEEKKELLRNCAALVVPSIWWEPLGLVLYEAYDYGKPVLAARSGGIVDHVVDKVTGWLHDPGDSGTLSSHLLEAASKPEARRLMGANGRRLLLQRSAAIWICDFNEFLGKIVAKGTSIPCTANPKPISTSIPNDVPPICLQAYLADQNPGYDRSFGISRMSQVVLDTLQAGGKVRIEAITSRTSQHAPENVHSIQILPWGTRRKWVRLLTDHFHPFFTRKGPAPEIYFFPKGYMPLMSSLCCPSVVTIHDTIIQYDEDHYPNWRKPWEYAYWALMLKHTLRNADRILTVSESSRRQINAFMRRHGIPEKSITVTYEPCLYEHVDQPADSEKENYVIHLASCEPHKRTAHLIRWWHEAEARNRKLPTLHLIGTIPPEVAPLLTSASTIVKRPFLEDQALLAAYLKARALILPSEIEGFGLPALEAYYLGTPVCFVKGTSVEEVLGVVTAKGGFNLDNEESLFSALDEVMAMSPGEVRSCGLKLRETYAAQKVATRMMEVFLDAVGTVNEEPGTGGE